MSDVDETAATATPTQKKKTLKGMKGIRERYAGRFSIIIELGYDIDPVTGKKKRKQQWVNFRATPGLTPAAQRKEAEAKRIELLGAQHQGTFVERSKVTLLAWLRAWLATSIAPPMKRPATHRAYQVIIEQHLAKSPVAFTPLQRLRASVLERYLAGIGAGSVALHAAVLHSALEKAVRDQLLTANPAHRLQYQRPPKDPAAVRTNCWSAPEASRFLAAAKLEPPQTAAYLCLALDSGARKGELNGLLWSDVDFDAGTLTIERQLDKATSPPTFGPTKTKKARSFALGQETLTALRTHRRQQLELRLKNGAHYLDHGLMFAKEEADLQTPAAKLGQPITTLSESRFHRIRAAAHVRRITFHGCRHTVATLLLQEGVPPQVVSQRLGHLKVSITMDVYAHVLPSAQADAAARLSAVLHGGSER